MKSDDGKQTDDIYAVYSQFYDTYVVDYARDLNFYQEYAKTVKTPVLEIGAGTGRVTIPLAKAGISIVALDISDSMLAVLKRRVSEQSIEVRNRIEIVKADACSFDLDTRYEQIIVPFYTFNYFLAAEDQDAALDRFYTHLAPQGLLLIDVFIPRTLIQNCPKDPVLKVDKLDPATGNKIKGWNNYLINEIEQIEYRRHVFEIIKPDGVIIRKEFNTKRRYFYPNEINGIFTANGFSIQSVFTGYNKLPVTHDSEQMMYVLKRN